MKSITVEAKIENVDKVTEFVNEVLEEKEREDFSRLKVIKSSFSGLDGRRGRYVDRYAPDFLSNVR